MRHAHKARDAYGMAQQPKSAHRHSVAQ